MRTRLKVSRKRLTICAGIKFIIFSSESPIGRGEKALRSQTVSVFTRMSTETERRAL